MALIDKVLKAVEPIVKAEKPAAPTPAPVPSTAWFTGK
jgi:hypothetical protein